MQNNASILAVNRFITPELIAAKIRRRRVRYEYPADLRRSVLSSLHTSSARNVAKVYGIPLSTLYRWRQYSERGDCGLEQGQACSAANGSAGQRGAGASSFPVESTHSPSATASTIRPAYYRFNRARMRASRQVLDRLAQARNVIEQKYFERIDCAALAAVAKMSRCHFVRIYRQAFGESPHQHLLRKRADAAVNLLSMTLQPTISIASAVGFESTSSLVKAIKKFSKSGIPHHVHL